MSKNQNQQPNDFIIHKVYTEDLSFESPEAPSIFQSKWAPEASVDVHTSAEKCNDEHYKVVLRTTVTAKIREKTAFLAEVKTAGIFTVAIEDTNALGHVLGAYCPNILFPYAKETLANLIRRGAFPEMNLSPINFDALYAQTMAEQQPQSQGKPIKVV